MYVCMQPCHIHITTTGFLYHFFFIVYIEINAEELHLKENIFYIAIV